MAFTLNLSSIQPSQINTNFDSELLPEGTYAASIKECAVKISAAGHPYFSFKYQIEHEDWSQCPFKGRYLWETLMVSHPSETVMEISQKIMADILVACGADSSTEINDLETEFPLYVLEKPVYIFVQHKWDKQKLEYRPQIAGYFGRIEFEGRHRYAAETVVPTPLTCINGNPELCEKATVERDRKVAKGLTAAKKAVSTPTPQSSYQKIPEGHNFQDVPF